MTINNDYYRMVTSTLGLVNWQPEYGPQNRFKKFLHNSLAFEKITVPFKTVKIMPWDIALTPRQARHHTDRDPHSSRFTIGVSMLNFLCLL